MTGEFASAVAEWGDFYQAIAGAAATLLGLLFVALALRPAVMQDAQPDGMRVWAAETFHNFLVVLAIAFTALIPSQTPAGLGIPLLLLGLHGIYRVLRDIRETRRDPDDTAPGRQALTRFAAPGIGYLLLVWAGVEALRANPDAMDLLIPAIFLMVISASSACWDLLREIGNRHPAG